MKGPLLGRAVKFVDPVGIERDALVTADWGGDRAHDYMQDERGPALNLVVVAIDETKTDQYGRQIERDYTSVAHRDNAGGAHGRYWYLP